MKRIFLFFLFILLVACVPQVEQEVSPASFEEYICVSRDLIKSCSELSSTTKSCYQVNEQGVRKRYVCYEGWKPYGEVPLEKPHRCGEYHCYPALGYCLLGGDINQPPIPREEICEGVIG